MSKKLLVLVGIVSFLAVPLSGVSAKTFPDSITKGVAQVRVYSDDTYSEESLMKMGSAVFLDNSGCFSTNSHVVVDLDTDLQEQFEDFLEGEDDEFIYDPSGEHPIHEFIELRVTNDRGREPEVVGTAEIYFVDESRDLAYGCVTSNDRLFTHFYDRSYEKMFYEREYGEDITLIGFPAAGADTVSVTNGEIVGFIDEPDVEGWIGIPDLDPKNLQLYKVDALAGPGISGGLMLDENLRFVGVPFAGNVYAGAFSFILSEDVFMEFEHEMQLQRFRDGVVPLDCVFDKDTGYYTQSGLRFYDNQCTQSYDEVMEYEITNLYQAFCGEEISSHRLVAGIKRSKEIGDLGAFSDYIVDQCGELPQE